MATGSRPEAACGYAGNGFGAQEEAQGASSGDGDFSRAQPLVSPREELPLCFAVVHPSDVSSNSLSVCRGFPSLFFIQKPSALKHYEAGNIQLKRAGERI